MAHCPSICVRRKALQYGENLERWQSDQARSIVQQTERDFLKFYGKTAMTGATGGLLGGASLLGGGAASEGSALGQLLTGKVSTGAMAGAINAVSQEVQKSQPDQSIRWTDAGVAAVGGALGVSGRLAWNVTVGAAGGYWQAQLDNKIYRDNVDPFVSAIKSGMAVGAGFGIGNKAAGMLRDKMPGSLRPILIGNMIGSWASEGSNYILNGSIINMEKRSDERK